jgi:hypothetical protein
MRERNVSHAPLLVATPSPDKLLSECGSCPAAGWGHIAIPGLITTESPNSLSSGKTISRRQTGMVF